MFFTTREGKKYHPCFGAHDLMEDKNRVLAYFKPGRAQSRQFYHDVIQNQGEPFLVQIKVDRHEIIYLEEDDPNNWVVTEPDWRSEKYVGPITVEQEFLGTKFLTGRVGFLDVTRTPTCYYVPVKNREVLQTTKYEGVSEWQKLITGKDLLITNARVDELSSEEDYELHYEKSYGGSALKQLLMTAKTFFAQEARIKTMNHGLEALF